MSETQTKPVQDELAEEAGEDGASEETRESGPGRRHQRQERAGEKVARVAEEQLTQAKLLAADLRHKKRCPEEGILPDDEGSRVEYFPATKPRSLDLPEEERGKRLIVVRCIECGETEVHDDESEG